MFAPAMNTSATTAAEHRTMTTQSQLATALLTEHLRYTPLTLLDEIINAVNELVFRAIEAVETGLSNASTETLGFRRDTHSNLSAEASNESLQEAKQVEIDNGIVQLETLLNATVDKDFDKFEIYTLRNILSVGHEEENLAGWVRLEHYKNLDLADAAHAPTPEQVQLQRRKFQETVKLNTMLKAEEARNQAVLSTLHSSIAPRNQGAHAPASPLAFLASIQQAVRPAHGQPLHQDVDYATAQLPALRDLLAQLKDASRTIPGARNIPTNDSPTEARRRQYVGTQSRRAMERRGLNDVEDTTMGHATGRKIGRDEVEGIEAVVQALEHNTGRERGDEMEE